MNHGVAFGENISTEKFKRRRYDDDPQPQVRPRKFLLLAILGIGAVLLITKLFLLQVVHGSDYQKLADSNRMRTKIIHAPRGVIFDRNGVPLVFNIPGFRRITTPANGNQPAKTEHLDKEKALQLIAKGDPTVEVDSLRQYPYKDATSHVLGYVGQISPDEVKMPEFSQYQPTDWLGKNGIEGEYESLLRGSDGKQLLEVDALGKEVRSLGQTDPIPGQDITLTLDAHLQEKAYEATKDVQKGVVIASKPDGEILAMISRPSFDANLFTLDKTYKVASGSSYPNISSILQDNNNQPLLNRVIGGVYPPGSTFKIVTAASGLENKVIDSKYAVEDTGVLKLGEFSYANWYYIEDGKKEQGPIDVIRALSRSNDIFFYKLAQKIGVDKLSATAKSFGVGSKLGIDLGGEVSGLLPTKQWKKNVIKESWYVGDTFHYGIGQGYLLTTPLQVNSWTEAFANGGTLYRPHLRKDESIEKLNTNLLTNKSLPLILHGMVDTCREGGVAWPLYHFKVKNGKLPVDNKNYLSVASASADTREIPVACKTGTAQQGGDEGLPHAWITLFAPAYKPEIVVTVLVEAKGQGSNEAGPIAKKVLDAYFSSKK